MTTHNVFKVHINVDGAAFQEAGWGAEVADILLEQLPKIRAGESFGRLKDVNGNRVGYWNYDTEEGDTP